MRICVNVLFFLFLTFSLLSEENSDKYFLKEYSLNIISGGREKFEFSNAEEKKFIEISLIKINVNLFDTYSKVTINYIIKNKKDYNIKCKFLYPFLYSLISKKIEKTENTKLVENRTDEITKKGIYLDFKIFENGIAKNYEIEFSDIEELNIPFKIGNEKKNFSSEILYSEKILYFFHKYGFFSMPLEFNKKEKKIITISYITTHYNNRIETNFEYNNLFEDPSLKYMFKKINSTLEMVSDSVFYFVLYPQYIKDTLVPKKMFIKIISSLIDDNYLKILPNKYSKKNNEIFFKYANPDFKEYDNIYLSILPINSKNSIPTFYFKTNKEKIKRDKNYFYSLNKDEEIIFEYIPENNLSFLYKKENDKIGIKEIRILPQIFTLKKSIKDTNLPLEFEISFSDNKDFTNSTVVKKKFSYKEYYKLLKSKKYLTVFKIDQPIFCKFVKIKITKSFFEKNEIIQLNDIEFIN